MPASLSAFGGKARSLSAAKVTEDAIGAKVPFQFEKASPFRPPIARTMPHLGQCDAIATERYIPSHL
jgi:hypothetical protein